MPRIISFAWTTPALVAGEKTVTRRDWDPDYAAKFHKGDIVLAYNRSPRHRGQPVAKIRLTDDVRYEPNADAPASDYEAEGFAYLLANPHLVPKSMREDVQHRLGREGFERWRKSSGSSWVIRFEVVELLPEAGVA